MSIKLISRSSAYGFVSIWGRIGGIVAPQSAALYDIAMHLPYTVNGILGSLCALGVLLLHDTYSKDLQDKMDDDENEGVQDNTTFEIGEEKNGFVYIELFSFIHLISLLI